MVFSGPYYVKMFLTLAVSFSTVLTLARPSLSGQSLTPSQKRSITTILLLNLIAFLWVISMVICQVVLDTTANPTEFHYYFFYLVYLSFVCFSVFMAAYNPTVLCLRGSGIRKMLKDWTNSARMSEFGASSLFLLIPNSTTVEGSLNYRSTTATDVKTSI